MHALHGRAGGSAALIIGTYGMSMLMHQSDTTSHLISGVIYMAAAVVVIGLIRGKERHNEEASKIQERLERERQALAQERELLAEERVRNARLEELAEEGLMLLTGIANASGLRHEEQMALTRGIERIADKTHLEVGKIKNLQVRGIELVIDRAGNPTVTGPNKPPGLRKVQ